ncbi:hypothetical protein R3P38DRAFT_3229947 [Favolaschia claudopus]|uniref:Uncharacterized protein n=1 Tax=Favolaschia claudopus TaxID=2862362 RepID=A0AAV9ZNZ0_9AGAR
MTNTADPTAPPMETFIDHMKITKTTAASGAVRREVDLRDVLPVVLANMSPITVRATDTTARISRPGFTGPNSQMVIGKVKDFVVPRKEKPAGEDRDEQDPMENKSVRTNTMSLTEVEVTDFLSLPLFYVPTGKSQAQASNAASSSSALPTSLTGDSSDKPREIAANQKAAATAVADLQPRPGDFTAQYLRFIFLLRGTDTAVKVDKNVTAADALANYRVIEPHYGCYRVFQAKNGYLCPADYIVTVCYAVLDTHTLTNLPIFSSLSIPFSDSVHVPDEPFVPANKSKPKSRSIRDEKFPASINPWLSTAPNHTPHTTRWTPYPYYPPSYSYLYRTPQN